VKLIPLPRVPRALSEITENGQTITYFNAYKAALNAVIPVIQAANGRYSVDAARLPEIARALGLTLAA
jgi:hypothetical protein